MVITTLRCVISQKSADLNFWHVASCSLVGGCQFSKGNAASLFREKLISGVRVGVHTQTTLCRHSLNAYKPKTWKLLIFWDKFLSELSGILLSDIPVKFLTRTVQCVWLRAPKGHDSCVIDCLSSTFLMTSHHNMRTSLV